MERSVLILLLSLTLLTGCALKESYKATINQGNMLDKFQVKQLRIGMTQTEVKALIGEPVINNIFHQNTWEYINQSSDKQYRLQLIFKDDKLIKINPINLLGLTPLNEQQKIQIKKMFAQQAKKEQAELKQIRRIQQEQIRIQLDSQN